MIRILLLFCILLTVISYSSWAQIGWSSKGRRRIIYHALNNCHPKLRGTSQIVVEPLPRSVPEKEIPIPGILISQVPLDEDVYVQLEFWRYYRTSGYFRVPIEFGAVGCEKAKQFFGPQWKYLFRNRMDVDCPIPPGAYYINEIAFDKVIRNREDCILTAGMLYARYRIRGIFRNRTTYDDIYGCIYGDLEFKPVYRSQMRRQDVDV